MFRTALVIVAILLSAQCFWILIPELARPRIDELPTDAPTADVATESRSEAGWAARTAVIRGDLWADYGFTFAELLWTDQVVSAASSPVVQAQLVLDRALVEAPHQSGVWLLLAGLSFHYRLPGVNGTEMLKMSYYTGPSEFRLMPLRLQIATSSNAIADVELQRLVARDLRLLLARNQQSEVTKAYHQASIAGQQFIEQAVGNIDPSVQKSLPPDIPN